MTKVTKRTWLPLSLVVGVAVALLAGLGAASLVQANPATVSVNSVTVEPGSDATITLSVAPASGEQVGTVTADITFEAGVTIKSCTNKASALAVCNTNFGANTIRYALASTDPQSGALAELVFGTSAEGTYDLTVSVVQCSDPEGGSVTCTAGNGTITVQAATPTPTPAATPTPTAPAATPTPTPQALPPTGGSAGDSSDSTMPLVLGTLGLAVLAGGVWAVSRMRRESI